MKPERDLDYTYAPVCPHCFEAMPDSWEISNDDTEVTCGVCDKDYHVVRHVSIKYSTKKVTT